MAAHVDDFSEIFAKTPGRIKPGLSRMVSALNILGDPHRSGKNLLVAGTNGKGTTASFLWQLCAQPSSDGFPAVSLFSSPHLLQFRERYIFSRSPISHQQLKEQIVQLKARLGEAYEPLSFFEVATLLAFRIFTERQADERIWEVGLGGRWDCTNTVDPDLAVIVSIGLDHQEFLGDTLEQVLQEKLGVARPGKPLLLGNCPNLARPELKALCDAATDRVLRFGEHYGYGKGRGQGFLHLPGESLVEFSLPQPLLARPDYLIDNFILALAAYTLWRQDDAKSPNAVIAAIDWAKLWRMPGFFGRSQELVVAGQPILWDVCHNVAGAKAFAASIAKLYPGRKLPGLVSILADKDIPGILAALGEVIDIRGFYRIDHPRSPATLSGEKLPEAISAFDSFAEAWNSRQSWLAPGQTEAGEGANKAEPLVICGSVLALGMAMAHLADVSVEISHLWHFDRFIDPSIDH